MCRILFTGLIAAMIGAALLGVTVSASDPWEGYEERPEISEREYEFIEGKVNIVAGKIEAEPGARVEFPVYIQNNTETGFTASEIKIFFDKELSVDLDAHAVPRGRMGEAANAAGLTSGRSFNSDENIVTLSTLGTESITDVGLFFKV